jgi:hypothetical protein
VKEGKAAVRNTRNRGYLGVLRRDFSVPAGDSALRRS